MDNFDATFNCNGKVNVNDWHLSDSSFFMKKDVDIVLSNNKPHCNTILKIFNFDTTGINILLKLQHFNKCFESILKKFERHEKLNSFHETSESNKTINFYSLRKTTCEFVYHLRNYLKCLKAENFALKDVNETVESDFNDLLSTILKFLSRLKNIPASTFLYVSSPVGNKSNQPEYHMYHIHLDLRWLLTTLIYVKNDQWGIIESNEDLKSCIHNTVGDLIYISIKIFESTSNSELRKKTPYSCTCMRELWLMLQILTDELHEKNMFMAFWGYVNSVLNEFMKNVPDRKNYKSLSNCKNPELFCTWLIHHLTLLYGYDTSGIYLSSPSNRYQDIQRTSNTSLMEKILKAYVSTNGGKDGARDEIDEELCIMIPLLQVLFMEWWQSDFQLIALLFDCFHRRLDKPFLMQIRGPWLTSAEKKTPMDILNSVRDRLKNDNEISEESSFGLFLRLLGIFLKKKFKKEKKICSESKIWHQIKGRIYIKFTKDKLENYSQCGLYNFFSLYLTLAVSADTSRVAVTMVQVLPSAFTWSDTEGAKKYSLIWKSMLAVLLLYYEQNLPFKEIATAFTNAADKICCCKDEFSQSMMIWCVDVLRTIFSRQNTSFEYNEYELLGGWIDRYLSEVPPNRNAILMTTISKVWQKCTSIENRNLIGNISMRNAIWNHVVGQVRMMVNVDNDSSTNFHKLPMELAASFTIEACYEPYKDTRVQHAAGKLFLHFTTTPVLKDMRVPKLYLNLILQSELAVSYLRRDKEIKDFDLLCIQLWIKYTILSKEDNEQHHFLKEYIAKILIKDIMSTEVDYNEFLQSSEPFTSFLLIVSKKRSTLKSEREQMIFDNKCRLFLFGIEKWIIQFITDENKDSRTSNWIYQCTGLVIKHWAQILYSKDPSNMLKTLITKIALPPSDSKNLLSRMHLSKKIFSMIILSFEHLNVTADISLLHLIRELFEKYLPLLVTKNDDTIGSFKVADTLLSCFVAKPTFTKSIFFILGSNLITIPQDQTTHTVCYLVMFLLINLIKAGKIYNIEIVQSIVSECGERIFNCFCLVHESHPHKRHTIDFLREITSSIYYKESQQIRDKLKIVIWNVLNKNTMSHTTASFDLLNSTFKINKELYKNLYTYMEAFVTTCEKTKNSKAATLRYQFNSMKKM